MKLQEWHEVAKRGTSGDMVYDIMEDWKARESELQAENKALKEKQLTYEERQRCFDWATSRCVGCTGEYGNNTMKCSEIVSEQECRKLYFNGHSSIYQILAKLKGG